jgi:hypothetical protein
MNRLSWKYVMLIGYVLGLVVAMAINIILGVHT